MSAEDEAISTFIGITGCAESVAKQYLSRNEYDVEISVNDFYNTEHIQPGEPIGGERASSNNVEPKKVNQIRGTGAKVKSFSDLVNGGHDDDDEDGDMNFFTGGQKSGLAVEDPNKPKNGRSLVDDLLEKAQKEAGEPDWRSKEDDAETKKHVKQFKGTGHSLGSVDNEVESKTIVDPNEAHNSKKAEKVTRTITFWKEGFNVDDGELYKYDDPQNQEYLKQLNMGRAPLSLLNVQMFQDVDVNVIKKLEESYHDNKKAKPRVFGFEGQGKRLGSPVPGEPTTVEEAMAQYGAVEVQKDIETTSIVPEEREVKEEGDTSIQIRLGTGERIVKRFNSYSPVQELYSFVQSKSSGERPWELVTSFPPQPLEEKKELSIAEAGLKNSVVIQKYSPV